MEEEKYVIWSDLNMDYEGWMESLKTEYPGRTEDEYQTLMYEINADYLEDERSNLNIQLSKPILVFADLGLWNGRKTGYKIIDSGNIRDCLSSECDYNEWFLDGSGDLRCTAVHHDGTNHYLYRAVREGVPDWKVEMLQDKLYDGRATQADISRITRRLGDEISAVYGYDIPEVDGKERLGMERIDAGAEEFEEVEIAGTAGLFTDLRVDKATVPDGVYCYELRHGDDDSFPEDLEEAVHVNYFGSVFVTEKLELEKDGRKPLGYEEFGFTGETMKLCEFIRKCREMKSREPDCFQGGKDLAEFLGDTFPITVEEGDKLIGYMEGHDYVLGQMDGKMFRGDLCYEQDKVHWEPYTIDDAVNAAADWNYDLLQEKEGTVVNPEETGYEDKKKYLESLREDEKILDGLFERTRYGKEIDALAVTLAEELIADMGREGGIDAAVKKMAGQIKAGEDLLPDVSPALKKDGGRSR